MRTLSVRSRHSPQCYSNTDVGVSPLDCRSWHCRVVEMAGGSRHSQTRRRALCFPLWPCRPPQLTTEREVEVRFTCSGHGESRWLVVPPRPRMDRAGRATPHRRRHAHEEADELRSAFCHPPAVCDPHVGQGPPGPRPLADRAMHDAFRAACFLSPVFAYVLAMSGVIASMASEYTA